MEDAEIIQLYWDRSEAALSATKEKYGGYCAVIAYHVLSSYEDSEECVSEVLLRAWNAIPPRRPENLKAWLGKVTRNLALDLGSYRNRDADVGAAAVFGPFISRHVAIGF